MSDNEDLLGDDLGDQSLADYNLGNEEEEQLLADDYESGAPQNVPVSIGDGYSGVVEMVPNDYSSHGMEYAPQPMQYGSIESECVVPNITVEVPNLPPHNYAPEPRRYEPEHAVPPAMPAGPIESPQIVPSEAIVMPNGEGRERFVAERPVGAHRMPQVRDIPDTLDKVVIPRGFPRSRTSWRAPHFNPRFSHPYRRHNMHRGNFNQRNSFPPPQQMIRPNIPQQIVRQEIRPEMVRPDIRPEIIRPEIVRPDAPPEMVRLEMIQPEILPPQELRESGLEMHRPEIRSDMHRPEIRPDLHRPEIRPDMHRPEIRPDMHRPEIRQDFHRPEMRDRPDMPPIPQMGPEISPERPIMPDMSFRPHLERPPFQPFPRYQFRPEERPMFGPVRPNYERPMYPYPRQFNPRFGPPMREIVTNSSHIPQVTIRQVPDKAPAKEPEVRMLPVPLPPHIPPAGLAGKKVLINPHFKGNFQPPVEGLPAYIPTRIQKSPPLSPTNKFGPIKDIDDAAERFIAEQRNALARAAGRKYPPRRSPQRYIENTTIEIENELASRGGAPRSTDDDDLLRRQEEFINANRAGLRRRMRSPSPPAVSPVRRSPSPRRARTDRPDPPRTHHDEQESEYKRRLREQESLRERVLRAKEVRRRKNAVALHKQMQDRERETVDRSQPAKEREEPPATREPLERADPPRAERPLERVSLEEVKPDTTRKTPERKLPEKETIDKPRIIKEEKEKRARSPIKSKDDEVNSTCEALTPPPPPRAGAGGSPARTPPWPGFEDDDLDMILGDIDGILSDEEDSGRFKDKQTKTESPKPQPQPQPVRDLRSKLPPKLADNKPPPPRQKIVFDERDEPRRKEKSPPRRAVVSSTRLEDAENGDKKSKVKKFEPKPELSTVKSRMRITFGNKEKEQQAEKEKEKPDKTPPFSNRRVILQRKPTKEKSIFSRIEDRSQPSAGIFSRAVRTAINDKIKETEPKIEYESDSDIDEDRLLNDEIGNIAVVDNLPHGMTDTRLRTLAGTDVQSLVLDKEERTAKITFKSTLAAETFKRKFNNKMVAASRLTVSIK